MTASSKGSVFGIIAKVVVIAILVVLLSIVAVLAIGCDQQDTTFKAKLYKADELELPEKLEQDRLFGLFFYDADGVHYTRSTEDISRVNFDPNKPTAIFIHGMQSKGWKQFDEIYNPSGWLEAGYNFGVFLWSQVADCNLPSNGKGRIWYGNSNFSYTAYDENGKKYRMQETEDKLKYPTAMVFGAYYFDFMNKVGDYKGSSISIIGHSLGANTNIAIGSYFFTLYEQGTITKEFLPDRFVYLDAYMDSMTENKTIVPWLNEPIGEGGVIQKGIEVAQKAHSLGISCEYLKSFTMVSLLCDDPLYGGTPGTCKNFFDTLTFIDMLDDETGGFEKNHVDSMRLYLKSMSAAKNVICDYAVNDTLFPECYNEEEGRNVYDKETIVNNGLIGWSCTTPISVTYARNGQSYEMPNMKPDEQASNAEHPVVAGFVFEDRNDNGIYDDRLQSRLAGVTVALYDGNDKIAETTTDQAGAYRFEIEGTFSGKTYSIKATLPEGKSFAKQATDVTDILVSAYSTNNVNAQGNSESFSFIDQIQLKIVNVGVKCD